MLEAFRRDLKAGTRSGLLSAARRAYLLALLALAVPGLAFAVLGWFSPGNVPPAAALWGLGGLASLLSGLALHLARRAANTAAHPARQAALTAAIQAATAPGIPFLLGCAFPRPWTALLGFLALAVALHALVWAQLPGWVRDPERDPGHASPVEG